MRIIIILVGIVFATAAQAQQCPQCAAAETCIRDYSRAVAKLKIDYRKGIAEQRKGRERSLREHFSPRVTLANEGNISAAVQLEVDRLRDCLGTAH